MSWDAGTARRADLQQRDSAYPLGFDLQQALQGEKSFEDALRIVEPVNADHDSHVGSEPMSLAQPCAALVRGGQPVRPESGHSIEIG